MAITTYAELQAAVISWLARTDAATIVPNFIGLAEAQIARRLRRTTKTATISVSQAATDLPGDCAELRSLHLATGLRGQDGPIPVVTPEMLAESRTAGDATGRPRVASLVGGKLRVVPAPDKAYDVELTYFTRLVPLSTEVPTNAVLSEAPDLYLFGAMKEAELYYEHDERAVLWTAKFESALDELQKTREGEEFNASLRPMRLPVKFG